MVGMIKIFY